MIADILAACEDAVVTGRSKREFADLVDEFIGLVLSTVAQCHIAHGRSPADEWLQIEAIAISIVNDGFAKMGSDIRVEHTAEGPLIHDRGAGLSSFPGAQCLWDDLGLPRETDVPGQSWDSNGISTFFHSLDFADFRYWDAIYWRTGYIDRRAVNAIIRLSRSTTGERRTTGLWTPIAEPVFCRPFGQKLPLVSFGAELAHERPYDPDV